MSNYCRTQGFVLAKNDFKEADQIFNVYTKDFGNLKVLGRSIRKIKSKLRSGIDLFYLSEIEFVQGKNYKTLTDALIVERFKGIRNDLDKLKIVYQITELLDGLAHKEEEDGEIFDLLKETFGILNNSKSEMIYYYFLWNLLSISGYQIDLHDCVVCQKKLIPEKLCFCPKENGIVCFNCSDKTGEIISPDVIKILRIFLEKDWHTISRLKIKDDHKESLETVSQIYLDFINL